MITLDQYVGPHADSPDWTIGRQENAKYLLDACAMLETEMVDSGVAFPDNPATGSGVSGETYGGFRPQDCTIGAPHSAHKEGLAVDRYDPDGAIDDWLMARQHSLKEHGLFMEHPSATPGWCHLQLRAPASGNRVFYP